MSFYGTMSLWSVLFEAICVLEKWFIWNMWNYKVQSNITVQIPCHMMLAIVNRIGKIVEYMCIEDVLY